MVTERRPLTRQQEQVYDAIRTLTERRGYPPAIREICAEAGLSSTSTVAHHLDQLEARGFIRRGPHGAARAITVLP